VKDNVKWIVTSPAVTDSEPTPDTDPKLKVPSKPQPFPEFLIVMPDEVIQ
jgi:hypothetical protein